MKPVDNAQRNYKCVELGIFFTATNLPFHRCIKDPDLIRILELVINHHAEYSQVHVFSPPFSLKNIIKKRTEFIGTLPS